MLPILAKKRIPQDTIVTDRAPDAEDLTPVLEALATDMIIAIHTKDSKMLARTIKEIHEVCESHEEEPQDHSFSAQNKLAAQGER